MLFGDYLHRLLNIPHSYAQPSLNPYYGMRLPVPPPPNAVQYPRITLKAADWSPSGQCFTGECKVVAKTEGLSLNAYVCKAVFTISYVPVNEWYEISESTCRGGPVIIDSSDLQVTWDATGKCPVVEATSTVEKHWTAAGLEAHGPCELLVTPFEGSDFGSYACSAFYTLQCQCEPLEDWKEVLKVAENGSDFHEQAYEEPHKTGSQNDVKLIPEYKSPKTEREYFEEFPLPTKVVPQPDSDEQKESTPVRSAARERSLSVKYYADKKISKKFEARVHNANIVIKKQGRFNVSIADLCRENIKICTLLQNKAAKQSSHEDDDDDDVYKESETTDFTLYKKDRLCHAQVKVAEGLKSSATAASAQTVTMTTQSNQDTPKDLEKQEIPVSITSKPQEEKEEENSKKPRLLSDLDKLMAKDELRVAAENKPQESTETHSSEKHNEFQVSENQGGAFVMHLDENDSSEWDSDEEDYEDDEDEDEDEDDEDEDEDDAKQQDFETYNTKNEKDDEFQAVGSQGISEDYECCSESESDEEEDKDEHDDSSEWETVEQ